jgi:hypothetical protein
MGKARHSLTGSNDVEVPSQIRYFVDVFSLAKNCCTQINAKIHEEPSLESHTASTSCTTTESIIVR